MIGKFWQKGFIFFILLLSFLFLFEKAFDFGLRHNLNLKTAYTTIHPPAVQLLVLGPCEPLWMVVPSVITKRTGLSCYNLAESHSDFADNYLHLHLYLAHNPPPKYLLLFVTPESFDTNYNTFYSYRFSAYLNDTVVANTVKDCDPGFYSLHSIPSAKYAYYSHQCLFPALQGWKHYLTGRELPYYPDGFEPPANMVWDNHYSNLVKAYPKGYRFKWENRREKYLEKILDLCKAKDIKAILYESPVLKEMTGYQQNRTVFLARIEKIAEKRGLKYWRFADISWTADRSHFISPMVTNLRGSYLFSDTLGGLFSKEFSTKR